jgi:hypothetical protein
MELGSVTLKRLELVFGDLKDNWFLLVTTVTEVSPSRFVVCRRSGDRRAVYKYSRLLSRSPFRLSPAATKTSGLG